ncbi:unnamed protein product [Lymnaea stagnalis]|uniref:ACB domain-containing protein n=1 Tax=Lymnaea stagnalis TaxID=6523 RepID=A0AAV2I5S8_LYMST
MASSPKEKFDAAVKVIRGLPKNGSFQPSHELMLKFYSYYKQATEGPCTVSKPGFWDLVNRRKWEAWSSLGNMESEKAMLLYVDELKKVSIHVRQAYYPQQIVETMPQTHAVTEFLQKLDSFYEMVEDSENQNTLKIMDKPWANGSVPVSDDEQMNHSYNVTELLKQDLKRWQDSPIILNGDKSPPNGFGERQSFTYDQPVLTNGDSPSETDNDDDDYAREEKYGQENGRGSPETNGDWKGIEHVVVTKVQSGSASDSETENEEFCDTSDEPIEPAVTSFLQTFSTHLSSVAAASSTPIPRTKLVRFDPMIEDSNTNFDGSDSNSLYVNTSLVSANVLDLSSRTENGQESVLDSTHIHSGDDLFDISVCRGGEEEERKRKGEGQDSRLWSTAGNRGSQSGSADGPEGSGGSGGCGRRDLFPNPGGGGGNRGTDVSGKSSPADLNEQIVVTLLRLQQDLSRVLMRLDSVEEFIKSEKKIRDKRLKTSKGWWPLPDLSVGSTIIILAWPFVVHLILKYIHQRRSSNRRL